MSRQLTIDWLRQNITRYQSSHRVYTDVLAVLDRYPSLRPKTDVYTFDDGRTQLLLSVHGLLPITFRSASYNIPIAIWIVLSYPSDPPVVYVVPTSDMLIKPSAHVDRSGRCSIDYITNWYRKPEACSLANLVESLQAHFSSEPPLYAKSRSRLPDGSSLTPPSAVSTPGAAHPAVPSDRGHVSCSDEPPAPPRLPPKPFLSGSGVVETPGTITSVPRAASSTPGQIGQSSSASHSQTAAPGYSHYLSGATGTDIRDSRPPLVPPHPSGQSPISSAIASSAPAPVDVSHGPNLNLNLQGPPAYASYSSASPPVPPRPPLPPSHFAHQRVSSLPSVANPGVPASAVTPPPPPPPQFGASGPISIGTPQSVQQLVSSGHQSSAAPPVSQIAQPPPDLLDAEDDLTANQPPDAPVTDAAPPPPRPPNPQTVALHNALLSSFRDALSRLAITQTDTLARQRAAQAELLAGPESIRDESARLQAVRDVCRVVGDRWGALIAGGENQLGEMRRRGEVGVDEMVCTSSIVGNQLVNLVAEDNAIEDTIYHLHRALCSGRIDLERFLRTTRVLAEEQFMKRALVEKILRGLPMGMALR